MNAIKNIYTVGFNYYPHESLESSEWVVNGTKKQAKEFLNTKVLEFKSKTNFDIRNTFFDLIKVINL